MMDGLSAGYGRCVRHRRLFCRSVLKNKLYPTITQETIEGAIGGIIAAVGGTICFHKHRQSSYPNAHALRCDRWIGRMYGHNR